MNKMPCKLRREGWKHAPSDSGPPAELNHDTLIDIIFWSGQRPIESRIAGGWAWGYSFRDGIAPRGSLIRYWRYAR